MNNQIPWSQWTEILAQLKGTTDPSAFKTWLYDAQASISDNTITIHLRNQYAVDWVENRLHKVILQAIKNVTDQKPAEVVYATKPITIPETPALLLPEPPGLGPGEFEVELVETDPTKSFIMPSIYAVRFWQPYLGQVAFNTWLTLVSFAWQVKAKKGKWPTIQLLADTCANGQRYKITGRSARAGRKRVPGSLETLANHKIVHTRTSGKGSHVSYSFRVLQSLPVLVEKQIQQIPLKIQKAHQEWLDRHQIDYEEWQQLDFLMLDYLEID